MVLITLNQLYNVLTELINILAFEEKTKLK